MAQRNIDDADLPSGCRVKVDPALGIAGLTHAKVLTWGRKFVMLKGDNPGYNQLVKLTLDQANANLELA